MEALEVILGIAATIIFVVLLIAIITYVINGLFLMRIAKENNVDNSWMAWVPIVNSFYFGKIAGTISNDNDYITKYYISLACYFVLSFLTGFSELWLISLLMLIAAIAYLIFYFIGLYRIYMLYVPEQATLFTALSIFSFIQIIIIVYLLISKIDKKNIIN